MRFMMLVIPSGREDAEPGTVPAGPADIGDFDMGHRRGEEV